MPLRKLTDEGLATRGAVRDVRPAMAGRDEPATGGCLVIESGPTHEVRARWTPSGVRIEVWLRAESIDLPAEAVSKLHALVERRVRR